MNLNKKYELMMTKRQKIRSREKLEQEEIEARRERIIEMVFEIFGCEQNGKPVSAIILLLTRYDREVYGYDKYCEKEWFRIGANLYDNWQDLANYMRFTPSSIEVRMLLRKFSEMDESERNFVVETLERENNYFVVKNHPCVPGKVVMLKE